jgi:hypothetical protein
VIFPIIDPKLLFDVMTSHVLLNHDGRRLPLRLFHLVDESDPTGLPVISLD